MKNPRIVSPEESKLSKFKDHPVWSEECDHAFEQLKAALCDTEVLAFPDPELPYEIYTDASDVAAR